VGRAEPVTGDELSKGVPFSERQFLTDSFYLYHSFSVLHQKFRPLKIK
jgi:hypothetical protein